MTTINFLQFRGNISNRLNNLKWLQASLNKLIVIGLLYSLLGTSTALAMSPAPSPVIPKFDPIPGIPNLSIDLHQTDIALRWNATEYAEFYTVHVYSGGQWQEVEDIYSTEATYNYERSSWDLSALQFKITACKVKPSWLSLFWWEGDRCSVDSNIVQLLQVNPVFSLSSYPASLNTLLASPADSLDSQMLPADTVNAVRTIMATLRLRDTISWATQDIPWPIELDEENFTVTSGKTILVKPGNYHIELLATQGDAQYVARALNVALNGTQSSIPLQLKTVLGDGAVTIDTLNDLSAFNFQSNSEQLTDLSQPAIGVKIDGHHETLLTFNPQMGITPQYHLISSGRHQIQLKVHDANLLKGRSRPQQEDRVIFAGQNLAMDLIPLVGGITTTLVDGTATLNLMIPSVVVDEVGGDPNNLQVMLSLSGINNQPEDVIVDNLIYNATADAYEAQYTYSDLQADAQVAISLTFSDTSGLVNKLLGRCVANDLTLDSATRNVPCQMTVRRRAIGGNHPLAELGINVLDAGNAPVRGASVYAKRQGSQNNAGEEDLGTLLGVTGSGAFGTAGYLKTHLVPGSYQLTAKYAPVDGTAQQTISLSAFEKTYQDLILDTIVTPNITVTAPESDVIVDASYTISWNASDLDDQASISLYKDSDQTGHDGQLIVDGLIEGTHTSYNWNTSLEPSGNYYIYAKIDDGVNPPVYDYGAGRITVNRAPSIILTAPATDMTASAHHKITWVANDADNQANISLYYDNNNSGYDGTLITNSLSEGIHNSYTWNTSSLSSGDYHIYAKIDDGVNSPVYHYANGKVTVVAVKLNDTGITWGGYYPSDNNADCTGETIAQQDCSHGRDAQAVAGTLTKVGGGNAGFDFTKLDINGNALSASATNHRCVRDNHTGLIWEVKTDDGGIHDKDNTYRWGGKTALVTQQARDNGWGSFYNDWDTLVDGSNNESLCGFSDWRVPTLMELDSIVDAGRINPSIDGNYFPNTRSSWYWSSSPSAGISNYAWFVNFSSGFDPYGRNRGNSNAVRLVRSEQ